MDNKPLPHSAEIIAKAENSTYPRKITLRDRIRGLFRIAVSPHQLWVVRQYQKNAFAEIFSAQYIGIELAVACTITELESGGRNIYGADPASVWMNYGPYGRLWEAPVTKASYLWFGSKVDAGSASNGVGQKQLTSRGLQQNADRRGGCWKPQHNCAEGDAFFQALLSQTGSLWSAFQHYNGSGPAATNYANNAMNLVFTWRQRLGQ